MADWNGPALNNTETRLNASSGAAGFVQMERMIAATPRPFVLITERELSVLRRGLTKDGWKRSLYLQPAPALHGILVGAGMLSVANRWLDSEIHIPPRAGWYHDFFCDCGERLSAGECLEPANEYICPSCGRAYSGAEYDGAVYYLQHNHLAGAARALAIVYGIEKDRAYAEKAVEILLKYADAYPGPHTDIVTGGIYMQSLDEAEWLIALAQTYDLIYYSRCIGDDERDRVEQKLLRPAAEGLGKLHKDGSWGAWHLSALGVAGLAIKDASMVRRALDAFAAQLSTQLGDDGIWPESVDYHFYVLTAYLHFAEACRRAGIDMYNWEPVPGKSLKTMFSRPLDYVYPSFRVPAIHDSCFEAALPMDLYEIAHRRWDDPAFAWVLKTGYKLGEHPTNNYQMEQRDRFRRTSLYAFLFGRDLPGRTGNAVLKGRDFHNLGICTLRGSGDLTATLDYGPFMDHGHLDKLGFTMFANGVTAIPDYGSPGYGSGLLAWMSSTAGHNTVVVDGANQKQSHTNGLVHYQAGSYVQCAEAVADDCYPGVTQRRRIAVVGGACIIVDDLMSDTPHDYDWLIRCEGTPHVLGDCRAADIDTAAYAAVKQTQAFDVDDCSRIRWEFESGGIDFSLWPRSDKAAVVLGTCPTNTESREAVFYLCRQHTATTGFIATFAVAKSDHISEITRNGSTVRVRDGKNVDDIYIRGCGESADATIETDGEFAAIRSCDGSVASVALVRGSWIRLNGQMLVECTSTVDCLEFIYEEPGPEIRYSGDTAGTVKIFTSARAMRVNGFRASATRIDHSALVRITPQMLMSHLSTLKN